MTYIQEEWKPIDGSGFRYFVSDQGRVYSISAQRLLAGVLKDGRYRKVCLRIQGKSKWHFVHRLVAEAFHGERPPSHVVNHMNGQRLDNRASNLEYVTESENLRHAYRLGLRKRPDATRKRDRGRFVACIRSRIDRRA